MFSFERLVKAVDEELLRETGIHNGYEKYIGSLTLKDLFTTESIYISAVHASHGFMHKNDTLVFMDNAWLNSYRLRNKVLDGKFRPKYYSGREIKERGKTRSIKPPVFECKVVQKVICDYLIRPLLEPKMISTSYASVKGRGTARCFGNILKDIRKAYKDNRDSVIIITDLTAYFASISTGILYDDIISEYVKDKNIVELCKKFSPDKFGLYLGNELSQVPASFFPSKIDHYLKDELGLVCHRYMDDTLIIVKKNKANNVIQKTKELSENLGLRLEDRKIQIIPVGESFTFCKERFIFNKNRGNYYRMINPDIIRNEKKKLKAFSLKIQKGEMKIENAEAEYKGVRGMIISHPNTYKEMQKLDKTANKLSDKKQIAE